MPIKNQKKVVRLSDPEPEAVGAVVEPGINILVKEVRVVFRDYEHAEPTFTFVGNWTGRDVKLVQNLLYRKYLQHQQLVRNPLRATATNQAAPLQEAIR